MPEEFWLVVPDDGCSLCLAWSRMQEGDGNATYRNRIIDAIYNMDDETLERMARYEER